MEDKIRANLSTEFADGKIEIVVEGNRALVHVVSSVFEGLNRVKRQQRVYGCLNELIASGELHAVTIRTQTPSEVTED